MTVPAISVLRDNHPGMKITILTTEFFSTLYNQIPNINFLFFIPKHKSIYGLFHLSRQIMQINPDYIIDLGKIMQPESTLGLIFLFLAVVVMAPIGEEIVFRGFLQKFLEEYWKDITRAVLVTSLFFAMIHFNPYWTIQIYLLGVILGFLSWKTKSVIPSVILHSINNGMAFILTVSDEYNVEFYLWGNYVSPVFIIIAIYLSYNSINKINHINT